MHHLFRRVPKHLEDAFDPLPPYEPRAHDHTRREATSPDVRRRFYPELWRPLISEPEAKAIEASRRPPPEVDCWLSDMLVRKAMRPDNLLLLWDPQMPRWSFWARTKVPGVETGYSRVWIVGELEGPQRGRATDLDDRAEFYDRTGLMGPFRLPTRHEIDHHLGEIATLGPGELDAYLCRQQREEEGEKGRQFDDFTMDYLDHRSYLDVWKRNGNIRTWCMQGGWMTEEDHKRAFLRQKTAVELPREGYTIRVNRGGAMERAFLEDLERETDAGQTDRRDLQFAAKETALGRVQRRRNPTRARTL